VSTPEPYVVSPPDGKVRYRVAAVDLGIKAATPRRMAERGCEVRVLPATSSAAEILALEPDGVFFSNGPGDPAAVGYAVESMRGLLTERVPVFGICLGSQILGRALGLGTYKLLFGHRGVNQPVADLATGRVQITSHNHGFAVAPPGATPEGATPQGAAPADVSRHAEPLCQPGGAQRSPGTPRTPTARTPRGGPASAQHPSARQVLARPAEPFSTSFGRAQVSHIGLNDGVVEGLRLLDRPAFSVQYHPEAAPGPHDATGLFDRFCELMDTQVAEKDKVRG
jgi:carbamoyl-phosphate synthase small subunit